MKVVDQENLKYILDQTVNLADNSGFHNSIIRGKSLGTAITAEQYAQISAGTFHNMFLGDYWTIGENDWVIVHFDYYYVPSRAHHIVLMPRNPMSIPNNTALIGNGGYLTFVNEETDLLKSWNQEVQTTGGYPWSRMRRQVLRAADTIISTLFGNHAYAQVMLMPNPPQTSYLTDAEYRWEWFNLSDQNEVLRRGFCELPNMTQIMGHAGMVTDPTANYFHMITIEAQGNNWRQFALFSNGGGQDILKDSFWLSTPVNAWNVFNMLSTTDGIVINYTTQNSELAIKPRIVIQG